MADVGPRALQARVLSAGRCTGCGACLDHCPHLAERHERIAFRADCPRDEGRCWDVCPQAAEDLGAGQDDDALGPHRAVWMARATDPTPREAGQYGGTVTALALHGLEGGSVDAALLTAWGSEADPPFLPRPLLATSRAQVLVAAGSKYTACPTLRLLERALHEGSRRLLVVGRPCQAKAVRRLGGIDGRAAPDGAALVVGLLCMWALDYRALRALASGVAGRPRRVDVPQGRFVVETASGTTELPHAAAVAAKRPACATCGDFTAEQADLSVGSTEWKDDWNTLIVRTEAGEAFVASAQAASRLELAPLPEARLGALRAAALGKRRQAAGEA